MNDHTNTHALSSPDALSPAAQERLEASLPMLRREVRARGRRAATARITAGLAMAVGVVLVARFAGHEPSRSPAPFVTANADVGVPSIVIGEHPAPAAQPLLMSRPQPQAGELRPDRPSPRVAIVTTDPRVTQRLTARPSAGVIRLSDDELRAALRDAGLPDGLVRVGHEVLTLSEPPVPPEGAPASEPGHGA